MVFQQQKNHFDSRQNSLNPTWHSTFSISSKTSSCFMFLRLYTAFHLIWTVCLVLFICFFDVFSYGYGSIPIDTFLVGWTSIYQLFWGSLGTRVLTHPHMFDAFPYVFLTFFRSVETVRNIIAGCRGPHWHWSVDHWHVQYGGGGAISSSRNHQKSMENDGKWWKIHEKWWKIHEKWWKMMENDGKSMKNDGKSMENDGKWWNMMENPWKMMENPWKMMEHDGKSMRNDGKWWKMMENDGKWWKSMDLAPKIEPSNQFARKTNALTLRRWRFTHHMFAEFPGRVCAGDHGLISGIPDFTIHNGTWFFLVIRAPVWSSFSYQWFHGKYFTILQECPATCALWRCVFHIVKAIGQARPIFDNIWQVTSLGGHLIKMDDDGWFFLIVSFSSIWVLPMHLYLLSICFPLIFQLVAGGTIPSVSQGFQEAGSRKVPDISRPSPHGWSSWERPWNMGDFLGIFCQIAVQCTPCFLRFRKKKSKRFRRCRTIWYCAEWSSKVARG